MPNPLPTQRTYTVLFGGEVKFESTNKQDAVDHVAGILETSAVDAPIVVVCSHVEIIDP